MAKVTGELSRFQAPERIKVIDRPAVPTKPMKPMTILFAVGGLVGGLFLGAGMAVLQEMSDTTVRRIRQMEKLTGVPVLGRLAVVGETCRRTAADRSRRSMAAGGPRRVPHGQPGSRGSAVSPERWQPARLPDMVARGAVMARAAASGVGRLAAAIRARVFHRR